MKRLGLAAGIFLVAGLLALGAFSVLADKGGPGHGADHGVASGLQDGADDGAVAQQEGEGAAVGAETIAQALADAFGDEVGAASVDSVTALHDQGIGWGALFKLYAIAQARGITIDALLQEIGFTAEGEHDFAFGKMMNELTEAQLATLESGPKNLGQLISGAHHEGEGGASAHGNGQGHAFGRDHGTGQPAGVPAGE